MELLVTSVYVVVGFISGLALGVGWCVYQAKRAYKKYLQEIEDQELTLSILAERFNATKHDDIKWH